MEYTENKYKTRKREESDKDSVTRLPMDDSTRSVYNYVVLTKSRHVPPMDVK